METKTVAKQLMSGEADGEEEYDYRLPLSKLYASAVTDLQCHTTLVTTINPKLSGFHLKNRGKWWIWWQDCTLGRRRLSCGETKTLSSGVTKSYWESWEADWTIFILVSSHAEWTLGSVILLMKDDDTQNVVRALESMNVSQNHFAGLLARLLTNVTVGRK